MPRLQPAQPLLAAAPDLADAVMRWRKHLAGERRLAANSLAAAAARAVVAAENGLDDEPWVRSRNAAIFALLYGAGLRLSEALSVTRGDAPTAGNAALRVIGKGNKERVVPILPRVAEAISD